MHDTEQDQAIRLAIETVVAVRGVPADSLRVESIEPKEWPSEALGSPRPGAQYAQVITPGFRIQLIGPRGARWVVHTDRGTRAVLGRIETTTRRPPSKPVAF